MISFLTLYLFSYVSSSIHLTTYLSNYQMITHSQPHLPPLLHRSLSSSPPLVPHRDARQASHTSRFNWITSNLRASRRHYRERSFECHPAKETPDISINISRLSFSSPSLLFLPAPLRPSPHFCLILLLFSLYFPIWVLVSEGIFRYEY